MRQFVRYDCSFGIGAAHDTVFKFARIALARWHCCALLLGRIRGLALRNYALLAKLWQGKAFADWAREQKSGATA